MKFLSLCILLLSSASLLADNKDVFQLMPRQMDLVMKVDINKIMNITSVKEGLESDEEYKEAVAILEEKFKLKISDFEEVYFCANPSKNLKFKPGKFMPEGAMYVKTKKALNLAVMAKDFPEYLKNVDETTWEITDERAEGMQVRVLAERLLLICKGSEMQTYETLDKEDCLLKDQQTVDLLMKNGFGGVFSLFYTGSVSEAPAQFPWLKEFSGGSLNIYHDGKTGFEMELTLGFHQLKAVKDASLMINMGMSFLAMNPETAAYKDLIKFQSHKNDLILDVKLSNDQLTNFERIFKEKKAQREERMKKRRERMEKQRKEKEAKEEIEAEEVKNAK